MLAISLKTKMSLVVSLFVTVVISALALSTLWYFEGELKDSISAQQFTLVSALAQEIDSKIVNAHQELIAVAGSAPSNLAEHTSQAQKFLDAQTGTRTVFDSGIVIFSANGRLIAASPAEPQLQGKDFSFRDYIRDTAATGRPQISQPFISTQSHHHPIVMFTAPFFDSKGKMSGILAGALDLMRDNFLGKLATIKLGDKGYLYLYGTDRTLIVHHDRTRILRKDVPPGVNRLFDLAIQGFEGTGETVTSKGLHALSSFKRLKSKNWILAANFPQAEAYAPVYRAKWYLLAAALMALILSNLIVWWFMRYLTAPLLLFTSHVKEITGTGNEPKPFRITSHDEIGTLAQAFNEMLDERRLAEEELEFKNVILSTQQETSIDGIFLVDESNTIISYNRRFVELWGIPLELVEAGDDAPVLQLVAGRVADPKSFVSRVMYLYEHKEEKCSEEVFLKDGRVFERYSAPVLGTEGKYCGRVWYFHDITERKRMEETLRESEERYRVLVEFSPDAIFIRKDGKMIFANSQGAKLIGIDRPEDIYGREALDIVHPACREFLRQRMAEELRSEKPNPPGEMIIVRVNGSQVPVEVASVPFRYQGGNAILSIVRDITERRRMQDELLKAQKLESLGLLAGGIAHDFNNILTGIVGNLSIAKLQIDPAHKILKRLELCEKAASRATELTRQLLTFARGGEPVKKLINPALLIRETVSFALRGSNIGNIIDIPDNLWSIEVDESQLNQVLNNLLLNASQAMPAGGEVTIRAANETLLHDNLLHLPPGDYITIAVEDRGCGISQENLVRIYDPYFTTKSKGSGLGLTTVHSIVKRHGGAIEVSSALGEGTAITIHLPAIPDMRPEDASTKVSTELTGSGRVLVMDDEDLIREIATHILDFMGYEVDTCADGREAIERYRLSWENNVPYSAVILDLTIPGGMGGKEAAAKILEIDPDAVLIVSSGYSDDPVIANFRHNGFSGVVPKPFDAEGLAIELKRLIPNWNLE